VLGLLANVALDVALIPPLGAKGAALSTVIVEGVILVGTYLIFRNRVGNHFTAHARVLRIFLAGAIVTVIGRLVISPSASMGLLKLCIGSMLLVGALALLFSVLRCFPSPIQLIPTIRSGLASIRGGTGHDGGRSKGEPT
jgi:peptidoglycan biosynthesis protein MviN/MurJ (putative lipid II flippase)